MNKFNKTIKTIKRISPGIYINKNKKSIFNMKDKHTIVISEYLTKILSDNISNIDNKHFASTPIINNIRDELNEISKNIRKLYDL